MVYLKVDFSKKESSRIFTKIRKTKTCWLWEGSVDWLGYGMTHYRGKTERTHRLLYAYFINPIPRGIKARQDFQIDHLCKNKRCCNPDHLELVSQKINCIRANSKTHCKHGHLLKKTRKRKYCPFCDTIRHKKRMEGSQREYWLKKQRQATARYYAKNK